MTYESIIIYNKATTHGLYEVIDIGSRSVQDKVEEYNFQSRVFKKNGRETKPL